MKRAVAMAVLLLLLILSGCSSSNPSVPITPNQPGQSSPKPSANPLAGTEIPHFAATDLNGQVVTEQVFGQHTLTMINLWGTFCQPCIKEMPALQQLQEKYKGSGVKILGVVVDKDLAAARKITASTGAAFQSVIPDDSLEKSICRAFDYVPATIFVDSQGRVLEELVSGSNDVEGYSRVIDRLLQK